VKCFVSSVILSIIGLALPASAQHSGDPQGGLLYEPWPSSIPDPTWRLQPACEACTAEAGDYTSIAEIREYAPGEFAFKSRGPDTWWETIGDVVNGFAVENRWHQYVLGNDMFTRGNGLRCTFTFWGDPNDPAWNPDNFGPNGPIAWPGNSGVFGPFHRTSGADHVSGIMSNLEAGLETNVTGRDNWKFQTSGMFNTAIFDDEYGTFGTFSNNQPFIDAIEAATDISQAIYAEVELGDIDGAAFRYRSVNKGHSCSIEIFDNRDVVGSDPDPQNEVWIGFASDLGGLFVDDIIVEDDNFLPTDVDLFDTRTPTPTPTSTAVCSCGAPLQHDIPDIRNAINPNGAVIPVLDLDEFVIWPFDRDPATGAPLPLLWSNPDDLVIISEGNVLEARVPAQFTSNKVTTDLGVTDTFNPTISSEISVNTAPLLSAPLVDDHVAGNGGGGIAYSWCLQGPDEDNADSTLRIDLPEPISAEGGGRLSLVFSSGAGETRHYAPSSILTGPSINGPTFPSGNRPAFKGGTLGDRVANGGTNIADSGNLHLRVEADTDGLSITPQENFSDWVRLSVGRSYDDGGYDCYTIALADYLNGSQDSVTSPGFPPVTRDLRTDSNYEFENITVEDFLGTNVPNFNAGTHVRTHRKSQISSWWVGTPFQTPNDLKGSTIPKLAFIDGSSGKPPPSYPGATSGQALRVTFNRPSTHGLFLEHRGIPDDQYAPGDVITFSLDAYFDLGYDGIHDDLINEPTSGLAFAMAIATKPFAFAQNVNYIYFPPPQVAFLPLRRGGLPGEPYGRGGSQAINSLATLHGRWTRHEVSFRIPETGQQMVGQAGTGDVVDPMGMTVLLMLSRLDSSPDLPDQTVWLDNLCVTRCPGALALALGSTELPMISSGFARQFFNGVEAGPAPRFQVEYNLSPLPASLSRGKQIFGSFSQGSDGTAVASHPSDYLAEPLFPFGDAIDLANAGWLEPINQSGAAFLATGGNSVALNYPTLAAGNRSAALTPTLPGNFPAPTELEDPYGGFSGIETPFLDMRLMSENLLPGLRERDVMFAGGTGGDPSGENGFLQPNEIRSNISGVFGLRWFVSSNATDTSHNPGFAALLVNGDYTSGLVGVRYATALPSQDNINYSGDVWLDDFISGSVPTFASYLPYYDILLNNQPGGRFDGETPAALLDALQNENPGAQLAQVVLQRFQDSHTGRSIGLGLTNSLITAFENIFGPEETLPGFHSTATLFLDEIHLYGVRDTANLYDEDVCPGDLN